MNIVNSCANDIQYTDNNKQCQECKLSLVLSASAWSSLSSLINSAEKLPADLTLNEVSSHLQRMHLQSTPQNTQHSLTHFPFRICHPIIGVGHLVPI